MKNLKIIKKYEADNYFSRNFKNYKKLIHDHKITNLINSTSIKANSILEIGSANGFQLKQYADILKSKKNYGIDLSKKAIISGKKTFKDIKFFNYSSLEIGKLKQKFDLIICGFFLYQLDRSEIFKQFDLIYKTLNKNGYLIIYDFDPLFKHSNKNKHSKNIISYKSNYINFLEESGVFKNIYRNRFVVEKYDINEYKSRDTSINLFQKIEFVDAFPNNL